MKSAVLRAFSVEAVKVFVVRPCATLAVEGHGRAAELAAMRTGESAARLLYVGNTSGYKNLERLIVGVGIARRQQPGLQLFATIPAGHPIAAREGVIALGHLGADALREAYRLATALVMPSLVETVGLPMLEAMASGIPVIAADRPYAREACGDAALFFDPLRPEDIAEKLVRAIAEPALREKLARAGRIVAATREAEKPYQTLVEVMSGVRANPGGQERRL
jgi:glycosyltransferase involved in cell wall biosynthesis